MNFWMTVLAAVVGFAFYDILVSVIKIGLNVVENRKKKQQKIGFGEEKPKNEKPAKTKMRKIGFGEQD